ncbi:hypothetical protein HUT11_19380 [Streptomyces seoulensis]|nr:hypothetical protein HUT11_19380 [Streptomyces seoulensis]
MLGATVLALTGFSRGHGHSHGHGGGGGGCSSSHQDHDSTSSSSSGGAAAADDSYGAPDDEESYGGGTSGGTGGSSYNRRPGYRSTPSSSGTASGDGPAEGTVRLVSCATPKAPYATVEVANPNGAEVDFTVSVDFRNTVDQVIAYHSARVTVPANDKSRVRVPLADDTVRDDGLIDEVDHCDPDPAAQPTGD